LRAVVLCSLLLCFTLARAQTASSADEHLLSGATAFQQGRYDKALVEFKVAKTLGTDDDVLWYIAATLVNLKRHSEGLETFLQAQAKVPRGRDALLDYYEAVASYELKLYHRAETLLTRVGRQAGPRVAGQAEKLRTLLAPIFKEQPEKKNIDWYLDQARAFTETKRSALAVVFLEEGLQLAQRHPTCHRCEEARRRLAEQAAVR